jgi:hypothetical protein
MYICPNCLLIEKIEQAKAPPPPPVPKKPFVPSGTNSGGWFDGLCQLAVMYLLVCFIWWFWRLGFILMLGLIGATTWHWPTWTWIGSNLF